MAPRVSIIIPTLDGHRGGAVPRLLESIGRQTYSDVEVRLIKGVFPQGKAINMGAAQTTGELLLIIDDDARLADESVVERLVAAMDDLPNIGMAGASICMPPEATLFQRRAATQFPRFNMPVVDAITDSDMPCHGCCMVPRSVFESVGGEREDIVRGLDPDLRVRIRAAGHRVVLVPGAVAYHPLPDGWRALARTFFRNGTGSAYAQKFQPDAIYDTHEEADAAGFQPSRPFWYRAGRFPLRLARALARGEMIRLGAYSAYAAGYGGGLATAKALCVGPR